MNILYHHPICPLSRQALYYLKELDMDFDLVKEEYWNRRSEFLKINPAGNLPVFEISEKDMTLTGLYPFIEYMAENHDNFFFMPKDSKSKAETRKLINWFNDKFYREVTKIIVDEKMIRLLMRSGEPRSNFIRAAKANLIPHLQYLSVMLEQKPYICSENISCGDIAAAGQISVIDYFGEINWDIWPQIRHWYSLIKSRPHFRRILQDHIPGFPPPKEYSNPDF